MARMCFKRLKRRTERTIMDIMEDMTLRNRLIDMLDLVESKKELDDILKLAQVVRRSEEKFKIVGKLKEDASNRLQFLEEHFERMR